MATVKLFVIVTSSGKPIVTDPPPPTVVKVFVDNSTSFAVPKNETAVSP